VPDGTSWRLMLGLGAIPAASVVYLRRKIRETPRYSLAVRGDAAALAETTRWALGEQAAAGGNGHAPAARPPAAARARMLLSRPFLLRLAGTAGSWFLMDIAFYGNSVSSPLILKALQPHGSLLSHTLISLAIFAIAALPGYWVAVALLDKTGRRRIQWQGFLVMTLAFAAIALIPGAASNTWTFLILFAISYFFIEFGPNMTTFVYPSEIFPTPVRGLADGISAGGGKIGAFLGALLVPHLLTSIHLRGVMAVMAAVSAIGILLTLIALPEPKGQTLEEASAETTPAIPATATA
jgi:PHS family inorganic phosphate transporter-like MFS transporter